MSQAQISRPVRQATRPATVLDLPELQEPLELLAQVRLD
jgi:hypothetical protein